MPVMTKRKALGNTVRDRLIRKHLSFLTKRESLDKYITVRDRLIWKHLSFLTKRESLD